MTISYNQLIQNYNHFTIIDIRQPDEIECTLKNAINIPMNELTNNFNNYLKNNINYVLICHNGSRSLATAIFLRKYNYQVYSLENGIIGIY